MGMEEWLGSAPLILLLAAFFAFFIYISLVGEDKAPQVELTPLARAHRELELADRETYVHHASMRYNAAQAFFAQWETMSKEEKYLANEREKMTKQARQEYFDRKKVGS